MEKNLYCSIIHGGLSLKFSQTSNEVRASSCCLRKGPSFTIEPDVNFWHDNKFQSLRLLNRQNIWEKECKPCSIPESAGNVSYRIGSNEGFKIMNQTDLSGPVHITLTFDISCNLACITCNPGSSTFWQKHLKDNNLWKYPIETSRSGDNVISVLSRLDLSNLRQLVFAGGETLLGQEYWKVADWLGDHVPNAKNQLVLCFQTNGTQPIPEKNFKIIDKFHLVKLQVSIDGTQERFNYIRWPADWQKTIDNLMHLKNTLPSNVMFLIEETVSVLNLYYRKELADWIKKDFSTNREGDPVTHSFHLADGTFQLGGLSKEYIEYIKTTEYNGLIANQWIENKHVITPMIEYIKMMDKIRNNSFKKTFPEIAEFYARFL